MIVAQQGLTRDEWDEMFEWMVEEQGMSEIEEPDRTQILDYLAAHYNTDRPNFPRPLN
jgi:cytochrome c